MKAKAAILALFLAGAVTAAGAQSKAASIFNFAARAADTAQTCYDFHSYPRGAVRESSWGLPVNSCRGVAAMNAGFAFGSFFLDRTLSQHGHPKLGRWAQWISAAGASYGVLYSSTHRLKH